VARARRRADALLLAPGAGSDRDHPTLVAIEEGLAPLPVERIDFPYRLAGRRAPDRAPVLVDAIRRGMAEVGERTGAAPRRIALGGRSMGGRMCSMLAAEAGVRVAGLVLISYPLHPPGRPDRLRAAHLGSLDVPVLFVSGTRDPFGTPEELEAAAADISGPVTWCWIEGGRHGLDGADDRVVAAVRDWLVSR
jgi:predicted alpha/beta-hydrolase family hydrolase